MSERPELYTALDFDQPVTLPYNAVYQALCEGEVHAEHGFMRWGSNHTILVTVTHDDNEFMAVYKPRRGERPLWDFPDGTLCQRETASYVVSEMLGWDVVPPTVLRDGPRGIGSVQVFINHDPQEHYFTFRQRDDFESIEDQIKRMAVFDAIVNNVDRKGGHCLIDEVDKIWGIDHGLTFHPANRLRTVIWDYAGKPIDDDVLAKVQTFCGELADKENTRANQLRDLLNEHEYRTMQNRVDRLLQNGTYPMPGPGPNRPWPAV
ncbi:MAG: SCO1664 family protein [Chloroflexota bacterium]